MCPHCGYDLRHDGPVLINDWSMMGPTYPLFYKSESIRLRPQAGEFCYALMKAFPRQVRHDAMIGRLDTESEDPHNLLKVLVSRLKVAIRERGIPVPIVTDWGQGYRWIG